MNVTYGAGSTAQDSLKRDDGLLDTHCLDYILTGLCYVELDGRSCAYRHELPGRECIQRYLPKLLSSWPPAWSQFSLERSGRSIDTYCLGYILTGRCFREPEGRSCAYRHELPRREYIDRHLPELLSSWPPTWSILSKRPSRATSGEQSSSLSAQRQRDTRQSARTSTSDTRTQSNDHSNPSPENTTRTSNKDASSTAQRKSGPQSDDRQTDTSKGCKRGEDRQIETPEGDDDYYLQDGDEADEDYSPSLVDAEDEYAFFQDGDEHDEDYIPSSKGSIPKASGSKSRRKEASKLDQATAGLTKKPALSTDSFGKLGRPTQEKRLHAQKKIEKDWPVVSHTEYLPLQLVSEDLKQQGGLKVLLDWPTPILTRLQALSEVTPGLFPKAQKYLLDAYGTVKSNSDESPLKTNSLIAVLDAAKRIALEDPGRLDSRGSGIEEQRLVQKDRVAAGNESHADTANNIVDEHGQHTHNFSMYSGNASLANNKAAGAVSADKVTHDPASSKPHSRGLLMDSKTASYSAPVRGQVQAKANHEDKAMNPSRTAYRRDDKPFCTYFVMNGDCKYLHTTHGCRYPHFLPDRELCKAILPRIEYPPFWISQNAELYKRYLDGELLDWTLADFESRRHRRAGAMRVQHSNGKQRLVPAASSVRPAPVSDYTSQAQRSSTMATATEQTIHAPKLIPNTPDTSHRRIASPHGHEQQYSRIGERPMPEETLRPQALPGRSIAQGTNDPTVNATNKRRLQATEDVPTKRRETSTARDGLPSQPKTNASLLSRASGVRGGSTGR